MLSSHNLNFFNERPNENQRLLNEQWSKLFINLLINNFVLFQNPQFPNNYNFDIENSNSTNLTMEQLIENKNNKYIKLGR